MTLANRATDRMRHGITATALAAWYILVRSQRLVDGLHEVPRWTVGRKVMKASKANGTTAGAGGWELL